jgi:hypothetical protein
MDGAIGITLDDDNLATGMLSGELAECCAMLRLNVDTNHLVTIIWDLVELKKAEHALAATIRATRPWRAGGMMAKNILIFSDGTGKAGGLRPDQRLSNVYRPQVIPRDCYDARYSALNSSRIL